MDQAPKLEIKKPIEKVHDLLSLSPEQKAELMKSIEKWKGLVRIFVHPLFEKWRYGEENYDHTYASDLIQIKKTLSRILAIDEEKAPPLIIMEEQEFVPELKKWMENNNPKINSQKVIYLVNTRLNNPTPDRVKLLTEEELMQSMYEPSNDPAWKILKKTLQEVGVQKILLGGMNFKASKNKIDWTGKGPHVDHCVGIALSHLAKNKGGEFEVELSSLTAPFSERRHFNDLMRKPKE